MKRMNILIAAAAVALGIAGTTRAGTVTLKIDTGATTGALRAAAYDSQAAFDAGSSVAVAASPAPGGVAALTFENMQSGTYGIAVYLDTNGNDQLDTNLFGAPTEPFGFSMNPVMGFSAPKFDAFRFDLDGTDTQLTIKLNGN